MLDEETRARSRGARCGWPCRLSRKNQDFSAVQIETQQLGDGLFMLIGSGGNIALSTGPDGSVLVDTQFAPLNAKILAAVRAAGGGDVKYVINTHWHGDHTGGNEPLGKAGAVIIAHNNVLDSA